MKVTLKVKKVKVAQEFIITLREMMAEEHERYYGLPHGYKKLKDGRRCGYGDVVDSSNPEKVVVTEFWWTACSGNEVKVIVDDGNCFIKIDSRRHGIPFYPMLKQHNHFFEVTEYETQTPHLKWFETNA